MLRDLRTNYQKFELTEEGIKKNPLEQFRVWMNEVISGKETEPTAMVLSTIDSFGNPESRVVLLKELTDEGFIFYTNYNSKKGQQISAKPQVSALFFWPLHERQVRIKGSVEMISEEDSEKYFLSRPIESQLGAWASPQSRVIENRRILDENYIHYQRYFQEHEIKKPPHWGGYLIRSEYFEFWQGRSNRLHDRIEFQKSGEKWTIQRLAP
jgi:pyridoxamine 5'-phosphate oxidase